MLRLFSTVADGVLLHAIQRADDVDPGRTDLCPDEEFLQVSALRLHEGRTFRPHYHIEQHRSSDIAQESWIVVRGRVAVRLYDLDHSVLHDAVLGPGDLSITFRGGHSYTALDDDTLVYEYKTGPYQGQEKDKAFLEERPREVTRADSV